MTSAYPRAGDYAADAEADAEVTWMKQFILAVRQIRGEMDIAPSRKIPLLLRDAPASASSRWSTGNSPIYRGWPGSNRSQVLGAACRRARIRHAPSSASSRCWCPWPG